MSVSEEDPIASYIIRKKIMFWENMEQLVVTRQTLKQFATSPQTVFAVAI